MDLCGGRMQVITKTININTPKNQAFINITQQAKEFVKESNVVNGTLLVFIPHTTAAVTINENADPDVVTDMLYTLEKVFFKDSKYQHLEGNSDAHMKASLIGNSEQIIIKDQLLLLGTWQGIYFCEFDGPRHRHIHMQIVGL